MSNLFRWRAGAFSSPLTLSNVSMEHGVPQSFFSARGTPVMLLARHVTARRIVPVRDVQPTSENAISVFRCSDTALLLAEFNEMFRYFLAVDHLRPSFLVS